MSGFTSGLQEDKDEPCDTLTADETDLLDCAMSPGTADSIHMMPI